jgi:hypothetical protein
MRTTILAIATIVAVTGAFMLAATLVISVPAHAKITPGQTTCDGEPGPCPGSSSNPGKGHDEDTTPATNPAGNEPGGHNK